MGLLAIIDYSVIKDLCDHVKTKNNKFSGRIKATKDYEPAAKKSKFKADDLKWLVQEQKKKLKKREDKIKRQKSSETVKKNQFVGGTSDGEESNGESDSENEPNSDTDNSESDGETDTNSEN